MDFLLMVLAGISAYYIRFHEMISDWMPVVYQIPFNEYLKVVLLIAASWSLLFIILGLYNLHVDKHVALEVRRVTLYSSLGFVTLILYIFFVRQMFSSRFIVLAGWLIAMVYLILSRLLTSAIRALFYRSGFGVKQVVVVGDSKSAEILIHYFSVHRGSGYKVIKRLNNFGLEEETELEKMLGYAEIDEIIQADPNLSKAEVLKLYNFADEFHITFKYAADLLDTKVLRVEVGDIAGIPVVEVKKTPLEGWGRVIKRLLDLIISSILIIILSPVYLLTALAIKLDSRGPIFFSELDDGSPVERIGQGGKPFRYFKFRSMIPKSHNLRYTDLADRNIRGDGPMVKIKDDPRVTRVGKFIRRFSIDELPEFFLVFIGSMSLVGPRPHLPEEVAKYERHHKKVLTIKPGITGLAQVSGRSDLSFEDEVKLDTYYIENWSLFKDLIILIKTPMAVFKTRDAG